MSVPIKSGTGAAYARILGFGGYRPARVVTNEEIIQNIDSSDEWIQARSGIVTRRWANAEETVQAMSVAAAGKALANAGIQADQVGAVIVSTVSHLYQTPAIATVIADELGAKGAAAFDISAACAGFCYGVGLADGMVRTGSAEHVVVIGVERLSDLTDHHDRSTAFIFADGAGAAVVGPSDTPGIGPVVWGSDGSQARLITQQESWHQAFHTEGGAQWPHLRMEGNPVFRWAVWEMARVAQQALDAAGVSTDDLDAFIPHQANMRITDAMVKALKLPAHVRVARDIAQQGNTSAASIPLAIERMQESGELKSGETALIIGFGAGLAYAAQVIKLP
ncbi:MAG: ketoacyl-ACP synthase III [Sporichthyaceae bacterium]|nr:ketoacyl-ACP synthase III [Sporichthyaceae bacterium]